MHLNNFLLITVFALASGALFKDACAQVLLEADIKGQPLQHLSPEGKPMMCGVRVKATEKFNQFQSKHLYFDGAFMHMEPVVAGLLSGHYTVLDLNDTKHTKGAVPTLPMERFWFKAPGLPATTPLDGKYHRQPGRDPNLIYVTKGIAVAQLVDALARRRPIQIGFQGVGHDHVSILYGVIEMSEKDRQQVAYCYREFFDHMDAKHSGGSLEAK